MPLPLRCGDRGDEVRDLNARLVAVGAAQASSLSRNEFDGATREAILSFQRSRGLEPHGECDQQTWGALVEASFSLGNRSLYVTRPMLRGDDVSDLQRRLGSLGFDAGRADGIFGPQTEKAVAEFQRNAGLPSDGVAGPHTIDELVRLSARADTNRSVAQVREHEHLRSQPRELDGFHVCLGNDGSLPALVHSIARQLRDLGALVVEEHQPDWSAQARTANEFAAGVYLGLNPSESDRCTVSYFATDGFVSTGGRRLAELCATAVGLALDQAPGETVGMRLAVLRETRMPAVFCEVGPADQLVKHTAHLARALVAAVQTWVSEPLDG